AAGRGGAAGGARGGRARRGAGRGGPARRLRRGGARGPARGLDRLLEALEQPHGFAARLQALLAPALLAAALEAAELVAHVAQQPRPAPARVALCALDLLLEPREPALHLPREVAQVGRQLRLEARERRARSLPRPRRSLRGLPSSLLLGRALPRGHGTSGQGARRRSPDRAPRGRVTGPGGRESTVVQRGPLTLLPPADGPFGTRPAAPRDPTRSAGSAKGRSLLAEIARQRSRASRRARASAGTRGAGA